MSAKINHNDSYLLAQDISMDLVLKKIEIMIIIDLFVFTVYNFLTKRFHRNKDDAKFSTILLLSAFISFLLINSIISIGIIHENKISQTFHRGEAFSYIIIGMIVACVFCVKYYKYISMKEIEKK